MSAAASTSTPATRRQEEPSMYASTSAASVRDVQEREASTSIQHARLDIEVVDESSDSDNDDGDGDDDYYSLSESEEEVEDDEAREHERQRVLEAAGLIVKQDASVQPPPRPARRRSSKEDGGADRDKPKQRRPAPAAPDRDRSSVVSTADSSGSGSKDLPPLPPALQLDDAYDRYETFVRGHHSRLSVASVEVPASPSSPSGIVASPSQSSVTSASASASGDGAGSRSGYSQLLNFLGRKTPSEATDPRSMVDRKATISAPILHTPDNAAGPGGSGAGGAGSRANSPAFGTSWASLVDKSALEGIPTMERKRQEAIFELIVTEETYVKDLQLIVESFYSSMMTILERKAITVVFANIEDILLTNTTFMSELEQRQKECRLYVDRIGDILQTHMVNMAVYMEYCVNQGNAIKVLKSLRDSNPELASHLQRLKDENRNLDLSSYLLAPMQRITRYPLLIKQILHYTETSLGEEYKAIEKSVTTAERILSHINESIRDLEGRETLKRISQNLWIGQGRLDLTAPTRHMGARRLVKEGPLVKGKSGRKLHGFLCSDILVLTDAGMKTLYRMPVPLNEAQVKDNSKDDRMFEIALPYPRGGDAVVLRAGSVRDCQLWMDAIDAAAKKCKEAEKRALRKVASTSSYNS
ncbi:hypothetical protein HMN09_00115100 [Mycena chlorophos]|uniref:DH domain-containing protein n=1 Tax=Mycena chlorophos TaxID=658473 RepID=A0A8H6WN05_MYCCL|nr:hypothetical protein HMN09_00115100 [Mycena chlorophos]